MKKTLKIEQQTNKKYEILSYITKDGFGYPIIVKTKREAIKEFNKLKKIEHHTEVVLQEVITQTTIIIHKKFTR